MSKRQDVKTKSRSLALSVLILLPSAFCLLPSALAVDVYPTEAWPASGVIEALNGTTDTRVGLPYIAEGTSPTSTPPLIQQLDRSSQRENSILAEANQLRVVRVDDTHLGVFPGDYTINDAHTHFAGDVSEAVSTSADTYYVYLDAANALTIVPDGDDWPVSISQYVPLAEVTVASSVISTIVDRRGWARTLIGGAGSELSATGTDEVTFILDEDNAGAEVNQTFAANRGSTDAHDSGLRWNATDDLWESMLDVTDGDLAPFRATQFRSTIASGTAPFTVESVDLVTNLNADSVDDLHFDTPLATNVIPYVGAASVEWTAAPDVADVLYADGDGIPTWGALGTTSGVQAWDAELDALAGVASAGLLARTGAGTAEARTLTAGATNILTVTNGNGVSGNPTVELATRANYKVQVGSAAAGLAEVDVGATNTVLCGNTGANPNFRQVVNADINASADIAVSKLVGGNGGTVLKNNTDGTTLWGWVWEVINIQGADGGYVAGLSTNEATTVLENSGTTAQCEMALPYAAAGLEFWFVVMDADGIKVRAKTGDILRDGTSDSAAAGYMQSTEVGACIHLIAVNTTYWVVVSKRGTWTVDS